VTVRSDCHRNGLEIVTQRTRYHRAFPKEFSSKPASSGNCREGGFGGPS
jgi:hypothetical protein